MPDSPDYNKYLPNSNRFSLQDMGELAARLGSVSHFDRRGEIVFYDTFACGLGGWKTTLSGTGASVALVANHNYRYPYVARLICGTTDDFQATLVKWFTGIEPKRVGLEVLLAINLADAYFDIQLVINDGAHFFKMYLRFTRATNAWAVLNSAGVYQTVLTQLVEVAGAYLYVPIKIVADADTGYYVRLLVGQREVDLSGILMQSGVDTVFQQYRFTVNNFGDGSTATELYLAHVIFTANEP
jgi:hypothetical protein